MTSFDKQRLAERFSQAAESYDDVADVQRTVGDWLLKSIHDQQDIRESLDVGCGSGALTVRLAEHLQSATVDAIDLAPGMLEAALQAHTHPRVTYYEGDAESIPFDDRAFDLVFSNFVLQWCNDPALALTDMRRVLHRGGQLVLSLPGAGSLGELAAAWRTVDDTPHVHAFPDEDQLADWVDSAGFAHADIQSRRLRLHVADAMTLMRSLKSLGARNLDPQRRAQLTGKQALKKVIEAYEARRTPEGLPVTWNVLILTARR